MKSDESNNTHHQVMSMYVIDIYVNCPRCGERQDAGPDHTLLKN